MSATFVPRLIGDVTVVDAAGRITLGKGSDNLHECILDLIAKGQKKILLNLCEISYIDSSGIEKLVSSFVSAANHGGKLKLLHPTKKFGDMLKTTKLFTVFEIYDDEAEAVNSFR